MIGHFGNNAIEFMKRKSKPKKKNVELLNKFIKKQKLKNKK
tara:strand:- start:2836 stop:2958 length:123 start_codon:yes stop_codon:yes gene_type:complete